MIALLLASLLAASPVGLAEQNAALSFDSNGVPISYVDRGRGTPVVLIHGFTGSYARHWETPGVIDALDKAGYRVIALDVRGHGQSGKPRDASQYGLEMVRDVTRLLDHLGIDRAHVVGYSMGGAMAVQLLVRSPGRLITVALLGSGWEGDNLKAFTSQLEMMADAFAKRDATWLIRGVTASGPNGPPPPTDAEIAAANASMFARNDPDVMAAVARGMIPLYDVPEASLREARVPMLAMAGEHDALAVQSIKRMVGVVPKLEVVDLAGATHASSVRPSAQPLIAFLDKHREK